MCVTKLRERRVEALLTAQFRQKDAVVRQASGRNLKILETCFHSQFETWLPGGMNSRLPSTRADGMRLSGDGSLPRVCAVRLQFPNRNADFCKYGT